MDINELIKLEPYKSCYEYGESEATREVIDSLNQANYEYDSNMSIDMNIGSAMLEEFAKGYTKGCTDKYKETILKDMYWDILKELEEL